MTLPLPATILRSIRENFVEDFFSTEPDDLMAYGKDWTKVLIPNPAAVVRPRSTNEVARFVALCNAHKWPIVPSGGRTGLAGGAVATQGEIVLSLERMRRIDPVDTLGMTLRVQAGAVTESVHRHCAALGLTWPVDFASKGSSQVGGNIATNAGGVRVIRYGVTRPWVLGLEVVLANGDILDLNRSLEKNNTGVDLRQLFIGSEGTLGVITEATLKLAPLPRRAEVFLFAVENVASVLKLFRDVRSSSLSINAFEFFNAACFGRVERHRRLPCPFHIKPPYYVLLEVEAAPDDAAASFSAGVLERGFAMDCVVAQNGSQAAALWALRESISESLSATGLPHKNDISLPLKNIEAFCAELESVLQERYPEWEIALFGHIGDGNLHINTMKPDAMDTLEFAQHTAECDHVIFQLVQQFGGSISAEHGIGLLKKAYLPYSRTKEELALFASLKRTMDPNNILNPGKIFDV